MSDRPHRFFTSAVSSCAPSLWRALHRAFAAALIASALAACGGGDGGTAAAPADGSEPPVVAPGTEPPATEPPATEPPVTEPPVTPPPPAPGASGVATSDGTAIDRAAFGGAMADAEVDAAFTRLDAFVDAWNAARTDLPSLTAEAYASALAAALQKQADARYVLIGRTDFTVTVQLRDGTPYAVPTRFAADGSARVLSAAAKAGVQAAAPSAGAAVPPTAAAAAPRSRALAQAAQPGDPILPTGRRALFLNAFPADVGHVENQAEIADMFRSVGYTVTAGPFTVDALYHAAPADVMWLDTHGFDVEVVPAPNAAPVSTYALAAQSPPACTATPDADCLAFRAMLTDGRMVRIKSGNTVLFGLTPRFVRGHVRLASKRSLVMLDACEAADPFANPTAMRAAFQAVGAGLVYGWVHQVWAPSGERIVKDFFDLMLGTNRHYTEATKFRPFQVQDVFAYLDGKGLMKDDYPGDATHAPGNATLEMSPLSLPPLAVAGLILRPSIQTYEIVERSGVSRISILGLFGDVPGTVTVSGQQLVNVTWAPWKIEADLPNAGSGVAGPLLVTSNGIASPAVPITLWQGRAEETLRDVSSFGEPGFVATASCLATFRQNILETRPNLETAPARDSLGTFELQPISSADLNRCTWNVSGEGRVGDVRTTAAPAADAVTSQSPPQFTNLYLGVAPGGQVSTAFGVAMPMHYTSFDKDGKKIAEGAFSIGFDSAALVRGTVLSPQWRFDASYQGPAGTDPRDSAAFELHLAPQYVPSADTPR